jgi:hypothetical protein
MCFSDEEIVAYGAWLVPRVVAILSRGVVWGAVERVAAALVERRHLSGDEVRSLCAEACAGSPG